MKKFLVCLFVLTLGLSCTKEDPMRLCACSPVQTSNFKLIIKDAQNNDLLDPSKANTFAKGNIRITYKENGLTKDVSFVIRPPFSYGTNLQDKFAFYQLISEEAAILRVSSKVSDFFFDLGDGTKHTLSFDYNLPKGYAENVKIDNQLLPLEPSLPEMYGRIPYLLK